MTFNLRHIRQCLAVTLKTGYLVDTIFSMRMGIKVIQKVLETTAVVAGGLGIYPLGKCLFFEIQRVTGAT